MNGVSGISALSTVLGRGRKPWISDRLRSLMGPARPQKNIEHFLAPGSSARQRVRAFDVHHGPRQIGRGVGLRPVPAAIGPTVRRLLAPPPRLVDVVI